MPGFDKSRIVGTTDLLLDEFTCAICLDIFYTPMVTKCCRQTYCKDCIREWLSLHKTCPNDRKILTNKGLRPVPRVMINLLSAMTIKCDYEMDGCSQVIKLGDLSQHLTVCDYRPNKLCKTCDLKRDKYQTIIVTNEKLYGELNSSKGRLFRVMLSFVLFIGIYFSQYF